MDFFSPVRRLSDSCQSHVSPPSYKRLKTHGSSRYIQKLDHILSRMSFTSNPFIIASPLRTDASAAPETTTAAWLDLPRYPDVLLRPANGVRLSWRRLRRTFLPSQSTPRRRCWSIGPSSEQSISPSSPSRSSETSSVIGSVWRSMPCIATRGQSRLAGLRGPSSSPRLRTSILCRYASHPLPYPLRRLRVRSSSQFVTLGKLAGPGTPTRRGHR